MTVFSPFSNSSLRFFQKPTSSRGPPKAALIAQPPLTALTTQSDSGSEDSQDHPAPPRRPPIRKYITRGCTTGQRPVQAVVPNRPRHKRKPPATYELRTLDALTAKRLKGAFAPSTWNRREMLRSNYHLFTEAFQLPHTSQTAMRFFSWLSTNLLDSSLLTYTTTFLAMHPELKSADTAMYIRAIKTAFGLRPSSSARPLTQEEVYRILAALPPPVQLIFFIAWKTASRWADAKALCPGDIIPINQYEAAICFPITKATYMRPFRPDLLVHLVHKFPITELLAQISTVNPCKPITAVTTMALNKMMRNILGDPTVSTRCIKKGAADHLIQHVASGHLQLDVVGRLLKHAKTPQLIHDTSVRYTTDKATMAVAMGSGQATYLL